MGRCLCGRKRSRQRIADRADLAIASIDSHLRALGKPVRFHRHGHKVSFAVLGRAALRQDPALPARLAALDSTFWDQYGCLSARVHFVERGGRFSPAQYADALLAYSWDGLLPLDLRNHRPPGHFTTLDVEDPLADLALTASRLGL